jgi:CRISPR-associated protein Csm3
MSANIHLRGVLEIEAIVHCVTGLRIGSGPEVMEIGGVENVVVRDPLTRMPYIPGSAFKGALRSHYELFSEKPINHAVVRGGEGKPPIRIHLCGEPDCEICRVFGRTPEIIYKQGSQVDDNVIYTTRLKVDDAYPTEETIKKWEGFLPGGVEVKWENVLDRLTSQANPRQVERVAAGSEFNVKMSYKIFDERDVDNVRVVMQSMKLVEDDYLGGYGSRGYGRIRFRNISMTLKKREYYNGCRDESRRMLGGRVFQSLEELMKDLDRMISEIKSELGLKSKQ